MLLDINVPAWSVTQSTTYTARTNVPGGGFPILTIDKGSYIVGAKIESGIDGHWEGGIYNLQVGKYSSLAEDILFMISINHDYLSVYQGDVPAIRGDGLNDLRFRKLRRKGQIIIENDCWIGHGATIMSDVTICNGAVVGAMATVTKDVPPYAIVGGNPARIIGYRFKQNIIDKLLQIAWWDWPDEKIKENEKLFNGSVEEFVEIMGGKVHNAYCSPIKRLTNGRLFVYYLDMEQPYPLWRRIIEEFIVKFDKTDCELLLYFDPLQPEAFYYGEELIEMLKEYDDRECYINIYSEPLENDLVLLDKADYYITNRHPKNISRMCAAERAGAVCISGVNTDIFLGI